MPSLESLGPLWPPVQLRGAVGPSVEPRGGGALIVFLNLRIIVIVFINSFKDFFFALFLLSIFKIMCVWGRSTHVWGYVDMCRGYCMCLCGYMHMRLYGGMCR